MKTRSTMNCSEPSSANWTSVKRAFRTPRVRPGLALLGALDPHDAGGEENAGYRERQDGVGFVVIVDSHGGINPPDHCAHEPDKGKIPHSHRGYLNDSGSQCDNSRLFHYFGNRTGNLGFPPLQ